MENNKKNRFLVYENWRAKDKAVVHKSECKKADKGHIKITKSFLTNNHSPNDRWFGYFETLGEAVAFASLLPDRQMKLCSKCLKNEKQKI